MLEFIFGFLFGMNSRKCNDNICEDDMIKQNKKSKYVPKFNGYYKNEATYLDEDWKWIDPKFRKRYLNIYREDIKTILKGSWVKDGTADEIYECDDQRELELTVELYRDLEGYENIVIYENEKDLVYLNVQLKRNIIISIDKFKKNDCYECIYCFNYEEQFEEFECHSISLGNIFAQILILKDMVLLVSIQF